MSSFAIIIPARFGSTRFPGKPLALLQGRAVLQHVYDIARTAADRHGQTSVHVATEDPRILDFCVRHDIPCLMTSDRCETGTDRTWEAIKQLDPQPDYILNLQGDAPLTPPDFITALMDAFAKNPEADLVTPVVRLGWDELDLLRESKKTTPFSGTTVILDPQQRALWFSKNIFPAIRNEEKLRAAASLSPIHSHVGLYGYSRAALEKFVSLPPSFYEQTEGLEQLRALENGMVIQAVPVERTDGRFATGIDTPEDLARAEKILANIPR